MGLLPREQPRRVLRILVAVVRPPVACLAVHAIVTVAFAIPLVPLVVVVGREVFQGIVAPPI